MSFFIVFRRMIVYRIRIVIKYRIESLSSKEDCDHHLLDFLFRAWETPVLMMWERWVGIFLTARSLGFQAVNIPFKTVTKQSRQGHMIYLEIIR